MINFIKVNTVKEFEEVKDCYCCDSFGNIYSNSRGAMQILKGKLDKGGYLQVNLRLKNGGQKYYLAHRIIAYAFIPNTNNKPTVNHINHNRTDNRMDNLEFATMKEQMDDIRNKNMAKSHSKRVVLKNNDAVLIMPSITECAKFLGVKQPVVSNAIRNGYKCRGYEVSLL